MLSNFAGNSKLEGAAGTPDCVPLSGIQWQGKMQKAQDEIQEIILNRFLFV